MSGSPSVVFHDLAEQTETAAVGNRYPLPCVPPHRHKDSVPGIPARVVPVLT